MILLKDTRYNILYIIAADISHYTPDQTIEKITQYAGIYNISRFVVESNNFQQLMVDDLKRRLLQKQYKTVVIPKNHGSNKNTRISGLEAYVTQGIVRFSKKHQELLRQLLQFPVAKNDDGPDALQMAVEISHRPPRRHGALFIRSN